jgi:hypothetical protein
MDTTQNLPPSLLIFAALSLILCVWAIVDIFRSDFTRLNKLIWLAVVLFAPFGIFIYFFIGRRLKPLQKGLYPRDTETGASTRGQTPIGSAPFRNVTLPVVATLVAMAVFCVVAYVRLVALLGREKTGLLLLGAMVVVVAILTFLHLRQGKGKS